MTGGVYGINGGNGFNGVGASYGRQPEPETTEEALQQPVNNYEETQMNPEDVMKAMDQMAAGFVAPASESVRFVELDAATSARVAASMEDFEQFMKVASEEFGERNALLLADVYKG